MTSPEESAATPDRLEQRLDELYAANQQKPDGGPMNTLFGTAELMTLKRALLDHMYDPERWGGARHDFTPMDLVCAAHEVAHDQALGRAQETRAQISEQQSGKLAFDIFINFWLPKIAGAAYGESYAAEVRSIINAVWED